MLLRTSVGEKAALGLKPLGLLRAEVHRRVESVLGRVDLTQGPGTVPGTCPGGERQRLALARA